MSNKELIIPHEEISDPQTITKVTQDIFEKNGLNHKTSEHLDFEDDMDKKVRKVRVKTVKYFDMGRKS